MQGLTGEEIDAIVRLARLRMLAERARVRRRIRAIDEELRQSESHVRSLMRRSRPLPRAWRG